MIQLNLFKTQKQTHKLREQMYGYWGEERWVVPTGQLIRRETDAREAAGGGQHRGVILRVVSADRR